MATHLVRILSRLGWVSVPEPARSLFPWYQVPGPRYLDLPKPTFLRTSRAESQVWNTSADPHNPDNPADPAKVVSAGAVQDLPSSRTGGQDDVSSQRNSLKLGFILGLIRCAS